MVIHLLILHIAYCFGGAERATARLLQYLDRTIITRITLAVPNELRVLLPHHYDNFCDINAYGIGGGFIGSRKLFADVQRTAKLIDEIQPDIALGMMHYSAALIVLGKLFSNVKLKTIVSFRGPFFEYMRHHERGLRRRLFLHAAITATARLADSIIVNSQGTAIELQHRFFIPIRRIKLIPNGIDIKEVMRLSLQPILKLVNLPEKIPILCAIARLSPEKNLNLLLEAFRLVKLQTSALLIILGDGPERAQLESKIATWNLTNVVRLLGHCDNVYPYLRCATIFIHTCQFEGFGNTMLEALATGTAVIATDCPYGPREMLGGDYGLLVPPNDSQQLAMAILQLLNNEQQRQKLIQRGLERAKQFSIEKMILSYETEFLKLTKV